MDVLLEEPNIYTEKAYSSFLPMGFGWGGGGGGGHGAMACAVHPISMPTHMARTTCQFYCSYLSEDIAITEQVCMPCDN